jgi:hypothetical protein
MTKGTNSTISRTHNFYVNDKWIKEAFFYSEEGVDDFFCCLYIISQIRQVLISHQKSLPLARSHGRGCSGLAAVAAAVAPPWKSLTHGDKFV